jgi:sugar phosphate isomerase/epimerase
VARFRTVLEMAADLGVDASIGRFRGLLAWAPDRDTGLGWFRDGMAELTEHAQHVGSRIVLEPQCRYNTDFLNDVAETIAFASDYPPEALVFEADLYHMCLEERSVQAALALGALSGRMTYVQLGDSNRLAPGWGHLPWVDVIETLRAVGYAGWLAMEFLQLPDSETCAQRAFTFVRGLLDAPATMGRG